MTACLQFFPSRRAPKFLPCSPTILPYFQPFLIPWSDILILDFKVVKTSFAISDYLTRIALLKTAICYKNIDLRHFCRESREKHNIRVSTSKLWEYLQLRTSCKLCNPVSNIMLSTLLPSLFRTSGFSKSSCLDYSSVGIALMEDTILISNTYQNNHLECKCIGYNFQRYYWT